MKGFANFIITSIDEVEIEILKNIKEKSPEICGSIDELISIKESYLD